MPQIEAYAMDRSIVLEKGWKVELAKAFKRQIFARKKKIIPNDTLDKWTTLFEKLL